jgi:hypothetical protein
MESKTKRPTTTHAAPPAYPKVIETFREVWDYDIAQMTAAHPSVGNGKVSVRRYRITVEEIAEPVEVLAERLRTLWRKTDNHHYWDPLKREARKFGIELDPRECGADVKKGGG